MTLATDTTLKSSQAANGHLSIPMLKEPIFVVRCTESFEYFLARQSDIGDQGVTSPLTGRLIPPDRLDVQRLNTSFARVIGPDQLKAIVDPVADDIHAFLGAVTNFADMDPRQVMDTIDRNASDLFGDFRQDCGLDLDVVKGALAVETERRRDEFIDTYWESHNATFQTLDGVTMVFSADLNSAPYLLLAMPVGLTPALDLKTVETIGMIAAVLVEVFLLIGVIAGIKGRPEKAAAKIQELLQNSAFLKRVLAGLKAVKEGSQTVFQFTLALLRGLSRSGDLTEIMLAFFGPIFTVSGLIYLISSFLVALAVPWLAGAVRVAQGISYAAGLVLKINKLATS